MNVLLIAEYFPYPLTSGITIVSFNWARELVAQGHKVVLLSSRLPDNSDYISVLEDIGVEVIQTARAYRQNGFPLRWLTTRLPLSVLRVLTTELRSETNRIVYQAAIDAVILVGAPLAALLTSPDFSVPIIYMPIDSISQKLYRRTSHTDNLLRKTYTKLETSKWAYVEEYLCPRAAGCIAITENDAQSISNKWPKPAKEQISVITLGVDTEFFKPDPAISEIATKLVFTGTMSTPQSVVSLEWFLTEVYPLLTEKLDNLSMDIVGREPPKRLYELASMYEDVHIVGEVPDLRPYMAQAAVYVAPMIIGSGIKNRVLEAMAMGKTVVATPRAANGIDANEGEQPLVIAASEAPEFARRISELLADSDQRCSMGALARHYVVKYHSWSAMGKLLEGVLKDVVVEQIDYNAE